MMEARSVTELILNNQFYEACKEVSSKDFEIQTLCPSKHSHWRHVMRAKLRGIIPAVTLDYPTRVAFYLCLATCFEYLGDETSKHANEVQLASQYQVVVNLFKCNSNAQEKAEVLALFGNECAQKGYLQQAILTYEEIIRGTNNTKLRDTLLHGLRELYQERFLKYFLANNDGLFDSCEVKSPRLSVCIERKMKGVRKAEQELMRRKHQRARTQQQRMNKDTF